MTTTMAHSQAAVSLTFRKFFLCVIILVVLVSGSTKAGSSAKTVEYHISEEQPPNVLLGNIVVDAALNSEFTASGIAEFHFRFLTTAASSSGHSRMFSLQNGTGFLSTTETIDRETVCARQKGACTIELDVAVQPLAYFRIIRIIVHVQDLNDNSPSFPERQMTVRVAENSAVGSTFVLPSALDRDSMHYGIQDYRLLTDSDKFELRVLRDEDMGDAKPRLVLLARLDRENIGFYSLQLVALDGGTPPKFGSVQINIAVLDTNDNAPLFKNDSYVINVDETQPAESVILRIVAEDSDEGENGEVLYSFTRETINSHGSLFGILANTGDIYIKKQLDHEEASQYYLSVKAEDRGQHSLTSYAKITVNVLDVNDHAPQITVNLFTSSTRAEIMEDSAIGTFVAHISIVDPDSGRNGMFTCSLDSRQFALRPLYKTEYKIVSTQLFDREELSEYHLKLTCRDKGQPSLTSVQDISVTIKDVNDNRPQFRQHVYSVSIRENNSLTDTLCHVNAVDADSGENGLVSYTIRSIHGTNHPLVIEPTTGVVTVNTVLDYEQHHSLNFVITAVDHGIPPRSSTAVLSMTIIDINDEQPTFRETSYSFGTFENQPVGTYVGAVKAYDFDSPPYNEVTYTFNRQLSDIESFAIDEESGRIIITEMLDRETHAIYHIIVTATDKDSGMSSSVNVTIYVADRNDNAPTIDFPTYANTTVEVSSHATRGDVVIEIQAHDLDVGVNSGLRYLIMDGPGKDLFEIVDPSKGTVKVKRSLSSHNNQLFRLALLVRDGGTPSLTVATEFFIFVNDSIVATLPSIGRPIGTGIVILISVVATAIVMVLLVTLIVLLWKRRSGMHHSKGLKYDFHIEINKVAKRDICDGDGGNDVMQTSIQLGNDRPTNAGTLKEPLQMEQLWPLAVYLDEMTQPQTPNNGVYGDGVSESTDYMTSATSPRQQYMHYLEDPCRKLLYYPSNQQPLRTISLTSEEQYSDHGSITDSGHGPSEEGEIVGPGIPPLPLSDDQEGRILTPEECVTDGPSTALPGLARGYHHQSAPVLIYNALPQDHGRAPITCREETQRRYPQFSCGSNDTVTKNSPYSQHTAKTNSPYSNDHNCYRHMHNNSTLPHFHARNNEYGTPTKDTPNQSNCCHRENVGHCVHDVIAQYLPHSGSRYAGEHELLGEDDSLRGELASVDEDSDDNSTTSGSYVLDADDQIKEQRNAFHDVFV